VFDLVEAQEGGSIFNLIDNCGQASAALQVAAGQLDNENFHVFASKTRRMLDRFSFELQKEIRRIEDHELRSARAYREETLPADLLIPRCIHLLQAACDEYEDALASRLTAHSRAMLKRQHVRIKDAYEQLTLLQRVASQQLDAENVEASIYIDNLAGNSSRHRAHKE
jgi:hypothetical protein